MSTTDDLIIQSPIYITDRNGNIAYGRTGAFLNGEEFEKIVTSLVGHDYKGKQIASHIESLRRLSHHLWAMITRENRFPPYIE